MISARLRDSYSAFRRQSALYKSASFPSTTAMSSPVISFCMDHNLTNMYNLLSHIGTMNCVQEVSAINMLEELVAGDNEKLAILREIKNEISPVEKAARHRAFVARELANITEKEQNIIPTLQKEIDELRAALANRKAELARKRALAEAAAAPQPQEAEDSDPDATQLPGSPETQPGNAAEDAARERGEF